MASMFVVAALSVFLSMNLTNGIAVHRRTVLNGRTRTVWIGARPPRPRTSLVLHGRGCTGHLVTVQSCRARREPVGQYARLPECHRPRRPLGLGSHPR